MFAKASVKRKKNAVVTIYSLGDWDELLVNIDLILIFYFCVAKEINIYLKLSMCASDGTLCYLETTVLTVLQCK